MNLHTFESHISKVIVKRGLDYYNAGYVDFLGRDGADYMFEIEGNYGVYHISVTVQNEEIKESYCDCPYDGPICKHEVATYYEIRNMKEDVEDSIIEDGLSIEEVVESLSLQELSNLVLELAKMDKGIEKRLLLQHGSLEQQGLSGLRNMLGFIMGKYGVQKRRIKGTDVQAFVGELDLLVGHVKRKQMHGDYRTALDMALLLLQEGICVVDTIEDTNGDVYEYIERIILLLTEIINGVPKTYDRQAMAEQLLEETEQTYLYGREEYKDELYRLCLAFVDLPSFSDALYVVIWRERNRIRKTSPRYKVLLEIEESTRREEK